MDLSKNGVWLALSVIVVLMVSMAVLSYQSLAALAEMRSNVSHAHVVLLKLELLQTGLLDAETGQRGYLLTGKDTYLEPYNLARKNIPTVLEELRSLLNNDAEQLRLLALCSQDEFSKLEELNETITLAKKHKQDSALQIVETDRGKVLMDNVRKYVQQMKQGEQVLLKERDRKVEDSRIQANIISMVMAALATLVSVLTTIFLMREVAQRRKGEDSIKELNNSLNVKVAELGLLNSELSTARDQAEAASKFKSEFVANMSHEIRTPMNGIIGMCNVLQKTKLDERQRSYSAAIRDAANALLTVINDILDFSKIEAGRIEIELVDFDPVKVVEGTCEILAEQAKNKKLSLMSYIDPSMKKQMRGDPERVRQVLLNLVSNAVKFSDNGEIVVKAVVESIAGTMLNVRFSVIDNGIGLSDEEQQRLFRPFVQADGSINRKYGGTGLGLSISKRLVELMGGKMGIISEKNKGATFWFTVPFEGRSEAAVLSPKQELTNIRVLIVDDEPFAREILHEYVVSWGMRNGTAGSAEQALRLLKQAYVNGDPYTAAVVDLMMPGKSGIDFAKEIFGDPALSSTKLILVTAFDTPGLGTQAIDLGFKAYITKPVRQSQFLDCLVGVICGGRQLMSKNSMDMRALTPKPGISRSEVILVAEDHAINQKVAQLYLDELGFACRIVNNGKEAIEAVAAREFGLILMDCQMPEMDGMTATGAIRKAEALTGKHVPIIAMTAHAMQGDRERCIAAGMDDYISKPLDASQLQAILEKWLEPDKIAVAPSPIDFEVVLSKYGQTAAREIWELFLNDTPVQLAKLPDNGNVPNLNDISLVVHGLKGVCAAVGAEKMFELCLQIESAAREERGTTISPMVRDLRAEFSRVQDALLKRLPDLLPNLK